MMDTDTYSYLSKGHIVIAAMASKYKSEHLLLQISAITRFEVLRGLMVRGAIRQELDFEKFCNDNIVLPVTDAVLNRAAQIYADLWRKGRIIGDADILIAATAIEHQLVLVTNNLRHFEHIDGLTVENWSV